MSKKRLSKAELKRNCEAAEERWRQQRFAEQRTLEQRLEQEQKDQEEREQEELWKREEEDAKTPLHRAAKTRGL